MENQHRNINGADACSSQQIQKDFMNVARLNPPVNPYPSAKKTCEGQIEDLVSLKNRAEQSNSINLKSKKECKLHYLMEGLNVDKF